MTEQGDNPASEPISFDAASAVEGGDRRYVAQVHPSWDGPLTTHGGLLAAIALNAISAEIDPTAAMTPLSLTSHYLRPPTHGRIEIFVDPLRRGRRFASTRASVTQDGKPCIALLATHRARELDELESWTPPAPKVIPAPTRDAGFADPTEIATSPDRWLRFPGQAPPFFQRMLLAPRFGGMLYSGTPADPVQGTENGGWIMTREPRPIDAAWLCFMVDALWPSVLQPLSKPAIAPTLDLTTHFRVSLPPEGLPDQPLLVYNNSIAVEDGIADSDSRVFSLDGRLLAQGRQMQMVAPLPG